MSGQKVNYYLKDDGTFVIENYNAAPSFASFFPGIAGLKGIPMWAYYVNRAQGVSTFGIKNKNQAIMEFYPANTAYTLVSTLGFRTFLKIKKSGKTINYEAFKVNPCYPVKQTMFITSSDMSIEEVNETLGIKITVRYATLPNEPVAALLRSVNVENISKANLEIEIADGMPKLIPYFVSQWAQKFMSTTIQAWTTVDNFEKTGNPFFRLRVDTADSAEVVEIHEGNFYFGKVSDGKSEKKAGVIIDPQVLFGSDLSFEYPREFFSYDKKFQYPKHQFADNKYPCAFSYASVKLAAKKSFTLYSAAGHIESVAALNAFVNKATPKYFENKIADNKKLINSITDNVATKSASNNFDKYIRQTYLDNVMRGGYPITFKDGDKSASYYVYSRKHGDLERDYNEFQVSPNYYSQGNGNFRDVNQNRRKDIFFNPKMGASAVKIFYNLIQIDANNPLVVKGAYYIIDVKNPYYKNIAAQIVNNSDKKKVEEFFKKGFEPGQLAMFLTGEKIKIKVSLEEFVAKAVVNAQVINDAEHGEGFWVDHWTYNLDLLDSFLAIYPEKESDVVFKDKTYTYYDCNHYVVPRDKKHVLTSDGKVRRYAAVVKSDEKTALIKSRKVNPNALRTKNGTGSVYQNNLASKFLTMISVKLSCLDPDGIGIEMESDKPGWYDSLNGLPGIFGSSVCETFELKRFIEYFKSVLEKNPSEKVSIPEETARLVYGLAKLLNTKLDAFSFWNEAETLKENYRAKVFTGISGAEKTFNAQDIILFLNAGIKKINEGLKKALDPKSGLYFTYFRYEAVKYRQINSKNANGLPCVKVLKFQRSPLPLFLEGEVHYLKSEKNKETILKHIQKMRASNVYDKKLGMFKVNESLKPESLEIGRTRVFLPGWLENESVFMHMAYKYLLEILKSGHYDEFFKEIKTGLVCFTDPKVYGRSILENSSFICSSAFADAKNHGRGFVARLSGSAAELIDMWLRMTVGDKPFSFENGKLSLEFKPVIHSSFFTKDGKFSFKLFCSTDVTYVNPKKLSTYSKDAKIKKIEIVWKDNSKQIINGSVIASQAAQKVRDVLAKSITLYY
ncbi:hypothetical protein [Endomicrobium proavitum]|uniref:Cellobiose phosphorylase n=1 Tax=Endomicrobium proavitum TaxID=1408281 RepID=A0A0G3WKM1_9BACT|nr:hypothetical protein [Endomicrobium proavitum]AKL98004.1 hypothetical protein Epro_0625 [Endomicrobium proavitum]